MSLSASRILSLAVQRGLLDPRRLDEQKATRLILGQSLSEMQWDEVLKALILGDHLRQEDVARLDAPPQNFANTDLSPTLLTITVPLPKVAPQPGSTKAIPPPGRSPSPTIHGVEARVREGVDGSDLPIKDWPRYELIRLLGSGGMGKVYAAKDRKLGRLVAIKFLIFESPRLLERFQQEARAQARIDHPNVCRVHEVGEVEGRPYIAMQFIDGQAIDKVQDELTVEQKVTVIRDVSLALHEAHRMGIIHRDVKPSNIMLERRAEAWHPIIMDFGLACETEAPRLTQTGMVMGTPGYLPPELVRGEKSGLDRRSDVYSLGATLYELLTKRIPFEGSDIMDMLWRTLEEDPPTPRSVNPALPSELDLIVMKCLEKAPARRYDSAKALAEDLQRFLDGDSILATKNSLSQRLNKLARRNKAATAVGAIAALVLLALLGLWFRSAQQARLQVVLAARLGQEVQAMESSLRTEALLPLHDTSAAQAQVKAHMASIEKEMANAGSGAAGPGHYALGSGFLSLGNVENARLHLDQAWAVGYRGRDVALALGDTYRRLYQRGLGEARGMANKSLREAHIKALELELRDPAMNFLKIATSSSAQGDLPGHTPEMLRAAMALLEDRYDAALEHTHSAKAELPGHFEALLLEGNILVERAQKRFNTGSLADGNLDLETAGRAYAEGLQIARSSRELFEAEATRRALIMFQAQVTGAPIDTDYEAAIAAVNKALKADPNSASALLVRANCQIRMSERMLDLRKDPRPLLLDAVDAGKKALSTDAEDARAHQILATALQLLGEYSQQVRKDPMPYLDASVDHYRQALRRRPDQLNLYNSLANTLGERAQVRASIGQSGDADMDESIQLFEKAIAINPKYVNAYQNLATTHYDLALLDRSHGVDPSLHLKKGEAALAQALLINPAMSFAYNTLGNIHCCAGEDAFETGHDPSSAFLEAQKAFSKLHELNKDFPPGFYNEGLVHLDLARFDVAQGKDARPALKAANQAFETALKASPDYANAYVQKAAMRLVEARGSLLLNKSAETPLEGAQKDLDHAAKLTPDHPDIPRVQAEIGLLRAWGLLMRKSDPSVALKVAQEALVRCLAQAPKDPDFLRLSAQAHWMRALHLHRHREDASVAQKAGLLAANQSIAINPRPASAQVLRGLLLRLEPTTLSKGDAELRTAIQRNPFLKREADAFAALQGAL